MNSYCMVGFLALVLSGKIMETFGRPMTVREYNQQTTRELIARYLAVHPAQGDEQLCQCTEIAPTNDDIPDTVSALMAAKDPRYKWHHNTVPYYIVPSSFVPSEVEQIRACIVNFQIKTIINDKPCIKMHQETSFSISSDSLVISRGEIFSALVGRIGGAQPVSIPAGCIKCGPIHHALMHALGFRHEQLRADRNSSVRINWDNIPAEQRSSFKELMDAEITIYDSPYDYRSLMHASGYEFGIEATLPTLVPLDFVAPIGQRDALSPMDIERIQIHYGCIKPEESKFFSKVETWPFMEPPSP